MNDLPPLTGPASQPFAPPPPAPSPTSAGAPDLQSQRQEAYPFLEPAEISGSLPETDASGWDVMGAAWKAETIRTDAWDYAAKRRREIAMEMFWLLPDEARPRIEQRFKDWEDPTSFEGIVINEAQRERHRDPQLWAAYPASVEELTAQVNAKRKSDLDEAQRVLDQPGGGLAEFAGTAVRDMTDQASLAMLPLGLEGGALRVITSEALLGAAGNVVTIPRENQVADELGLPRPDPITRAIEGAVLGGGLAGLVLGSVKGLSMWSSRRAGVRDATPKGGDALQTEVDVNAAEAALRDDRTVAETLAGKKPAEDNSDGGWGISNTPEWQAQNLTTIKAPNGQTWTVNRKAADAFTGFLDELTSMGYDVQSSGGFNYRTIRGSNELSEHARGLAIDINAATNPLGGAISDLPANVGEIAAKYGLKWGGDFKGRKDPMHFEFIGDRSSRSGPQGGSTYIPTTRGYTGEGQVSTGDGTRVDVRYEVVDASSLLRASGDLQPRDRTRGASDAWIADTAARLDPQQLMPSPSADRGAPIVGPDNVTESGNGRTAAIQRAYELHPERAAAYRAQIEASGFAVPEGVTQPVLIARRTSEMTPQERVRFAIAAQDSGVAAMTPTEVARASARAMTAPVLGRMDPSLPLAHEANAGFVRDTLASLPRSARNAMFDSRGMLNKSGERQLREALFARAWTDPDLIELFTEGEAGPLKSLLEALNTAAPAWAALKADIEAGLVRPEMDISGHVLDAMRLIATARKLSAKEGLSIADAVRALLDETDLLDGAISPLTAALTAKFWRNGRAAPAEEIAGFLTRYADDARKAGATGGMFGGPTPRDVLAAIDPERFGNLPEDLGEARGFATPPDVRQAADPGFNEGAASPEAEAADAEIAASLEEGPFGPVMSGHTDDPEAAIAAIMEAGTGEVPDAFLHPTLGPIAFVYGAIGPKGYGLAHIAEKHGAQVLAELPDALRRGVASAPHNGRVNIDTQDVLPRRTVVKLEWEGKDKTWVVTSHDRYPKGDARQGRTTDVPLASDPPAVPGSTAPGQDTPAGAGDQASRRGPLAQAVRDLTTRAVGIVSPDAATARVLDDLHAEFGNLELQLADGSSATVAEVLDDLKTDAGFDAFLQACAIIPGAAP